MSLAGYLEAGAANEQVKIAMSGSSRHADRSGEDRSESCTQGGMDELLLTLGCDVLLSFKQMLYPDNAAERCGPRV